MGAVKTKLESFKQPKQGRIGGGKATATKFGPRGGAGRSPNPNGALSMLRAMDNQDARNARQTLNADVMTTKRQGVLDADALLGEVIAQQLADADALLAKLESHYTTFH